jgi:ribosome-associated protein
VRGGEAIKGRDIARTARRALEEKQGGDIRILDVRGLSGVTDYVVVASGSSPPHLKALVNEVQDILKKEGVRCYRKAGVPECGWLVVDYVDCVIHIFSPEARRYYEIEALWAGAPRLD